MTTTEALNREEWMRRYAARVMESASWDERPAMMAAQAAAESEERYASEEGRAVEWKDPEDAADSEMSYWTDDGDE
jgi:hypothetical protein